MTTVSFSALKLNQGATVTLYTRLASIMSDRFIKAGGAGLQAGRENHARRFCRQRPRGIYYQVRSEEVMAQALYRKYSRASGRKLSVRNISRRPCATPSADRVAHAYLFSAHAAREDNHRLAARQSCQLPSPDPANRPCDACAHCLAVNNGSFLDLIEIDAASNTSVDDVRDLRDKINFSPGQASSRFASLTSSHALPQRLSTLC